MIRQLSFQFFVLAAVIGLMPAGFAQSTCPHAAAQKSSSQCTSAVASQTELISTAATEKDIVDTAVEAGSFKTLVAAAKAADLVDVLKSKGPFTVFAPTDQAFAKLPAGTVESLLKPENKAKLVQILTYHVVPGRVDASQVTKLDSANSVAGPAIGIKTEGGSVMVNNAKVVKTDIGCSNGLIHVIDTVIMPRDIVDTAVSAGSFNTLVAAVKAAGLVETLKGEGPFTVFAPTDEAFAKIPKETLQSLLKPENKEKLTAILTYHVISGKVLAADVVNMNQAQTVNGQTVKIVAENESVTVNDAKVLKTDIVTANGVIHIIDKVLMPE